MRRMIASAMLWLVMAGNVLAANITVSAVADLATARPGDGDIVSTLGYTTAGIGANTFRYDADSAATVNGGTVIAGPGSVGRYIAIDQTRIDVTQFGADPTGVADSKEEVQAANDVVTSSGGIVFVPTGTFRVTAPIEVTSNVHFVGSGYGSVIDGDGVTGSVIEIGDGSTLTVRVALKNIRVTGDSTVAGVRINNAQEVLLDGVHFNGHEGAYQLFAKFVWASEIKNIWTNGAVATTANIACGASFNANTCSNWYTSNFDPVNVLFDSTLESGVTVSEGNAFSNICVQGGDIGLQAKTWGTCSISGLYVENCVLPVSLGVATTKLVRGMAITGGAFNGPATNHPNFANRAACVELAYCYGVSISGSEFSGAYNSYAAAPVTITGGSGTGAVAVARVTAAGAVHSVEVICAGTGYVSDPAIGFTGAGTGATATVTRSGTTVGSIAVTGGGSGYVTDYCPVAVRYTRCDRVVLQGNQFNSGQGLVSPLYPYVVRSSAASSASGIRILGDNSYRNDSNGNACDLIKAQGYGYRHYVTEMASGGTWSMTEYIPPSY